MANKSVDTSPEAAKGETTAQGGAAPEAETHDDLAEVEAVIEDAQRVSQAVADEADEAAVESVESAVSEAQQAEDGSDGSMSEIVAALEEVESAEASTGEQPSLKEYDKAISGAVDNLLEGDFVSVDLVLEGMNETTPPPVVPEKESAGTGAVAENSAGAEPAADAEPAVDEASAATDEAPPEETAKAAELQSDVAAAERAQAPDDAEEAAPAATPASDAAKPEPAPAHKPKAPAPDKAPPAPESKPQASARPNAAPHAEPEQIAAASGEAAPATPGSRRALQTVRQFAEPAIRMGVVPMLEVMSMPLRFIPPKARDIIDWIALSLVFWVPIVWIFALFLVG